MAGLIPQPLGFQQSADLLAALDASGPGAHVVVVHAVTGMRGVGKWHARGDRDRKRVGGQERERRSART